MHPWLAVLLLLGLSGITSLVTPIGVLFACLFSGMTGWFGMKMATNASARTTFAAKSSLNEGLRVAFRAPRIEILRRLAGGIQWRCNEGEIRYQHRCSVRNEVDAQGRPDFSFS